MREILFRGKHKDSGEWVEGVPYFENNQCFMITDLFICEEYQCTGAENVEVIPETIGQYTGLTDKNGKKIFEGDVCKHRSNYSANTVISVVTYTNNCFWSMVDEHRGFELSEKLEVIGNVHDNKLEDF